MALNSEEVFAQLRDILCDILVLTEDEVEPSSKLVDDLDADSIAFLELTYRIRSDFGLEVPQAKVDEETLGMTVIEGMKRLETAMGGTTLFEFMQGEAARSDADDPFNYWKNFSSNPEAAQITIGEMSQQMGTSSPEGFAEDALASSLKVADLFRFITVDAYVKYVLYLDESQERIQAMGGADAMNAEAVAAMRSAES